MTIQEIKAIQISNFLASKGYEPINRKGNKWWYLSPLHTEKTASFKVDLTKNVWYDLHWAKEVTSLIWRCNYTTRKTFQKYCT